MMVYLLLSLILLSVVQAHIDILAVLVEDGGDDSVSVGGGLPPTSLLQTSSTCDCNKVLLSSLGPAATYQPNVMGVYTRAWTTYNNKASYRQNYGSDYRLYWVPTAGWMIGDHRGAPKGYIHNPDKTQTCAYQLPMGWLFYSPTHGAWYADPTLTLRCIP